VDGLNIPPPRAQSGRLARRLKSERTHKFNGEVLKYDGSNYAEVLVVDDTRRVWVPQQCRAAREGDTVVVAVDGNRWQVETLVTRHAPTSVTDPTTAVPGESSASVYTGGSALGAPGVGTVTSFTQCSNNFSIIDSRMGNYSTAINANAGAIGALVSAVNDIRTKLNSLRTVTSETRATTTSVTSALRTERVIG
jgi:hypothetical protein